MPRLIELSAENRAEWAAEVDLIKAHVTDRCEAAAVRRRQPGRGDRVLRALIRTASEMWARETDQLPVDRFAEIVGAAEVDALLHEQMLIPTADHRGYRFVHDDVLEWLSSLDLDPWLELAPKRLARLATPTGRCRVGVLVHMLHDVARRQGAAALCAHLDTLVPDADPVPPVPALDHPGVRLAREVLSTVDDARPYLTVSHKLAEHEARLREGLFSTYFWRALAVPLAEKLDLLRVLAPASHYYPWRMKDWSLTAEEAAPGQLSDLDYAALAYELSTQSPEDAIPALRGWLSDERDLYLDDHSEATVRDVALGITTGSGHARGRSCGASSSTAGRLGSRFQALARDDPEYMARCVLEHETDAPEAMLSYLLSPRLSLVRQVPASRGALLGVLERLYERTNDPRIRGEALKGLFMDGDEPRFLHLAIAAFDASDLNISAADLAQGGRLGGDRVLEAFERALPRRVAPDSIVDALYHMAGHGTLPADADRFVLRHTRARTIPFTINVGHYVERRLRRERAAHQDLVTLARALISGGNRSARRPLSYGLTDPNSLADDATTRYRLLDELVSAAGAASDTSLIWSIVGQCVAHRAGTPHSTARIWRSLACLEPNDADRVAISTAHGNEEFATALVRWMAGRRDRLGQRMRHVAPTDDGMSPAAAVTYIVTNTTPLPGP